MLKRLSAENWSYNAAAHLLNRAGFGGTPAEIQKLHELGLEKAVDSLVDYEKTEDATQNPAWATLDATRLELFKEMRDATPERKQEIRRAEQKRQREEVQELRYWWLQRMVAGSRPLQEKLALFWHGHFATSVQKVKSAYLMWRQNEIFRRCGAGSWLLLLTYVSKDPAMLIWLDQAQSRKEHPNENFAREVMELFTLGEGHYTEKDVTEAARAFTGWTFERVGRQFYYRADWHDEGQKTILGRTGNFNGDDVLKLIVAQQQAARFITRKLWVYFGGENPSDELVTRLAVVFRDSGFQFKPVLRTIFSSEEFYSSELVRQQVKSPVQWLVGSVRMLERELPAPQPSMNALKMLGQDLLAPPNVKGWDGGLSWITTNNLLNRYNFAAFLVLGENPLNGTNKKGRVTRRLASGARAKVLELFPEEIRADKNRLVEELQKRFLQGELRPEHQSTLRAYLESQGDIDETDLLHAIRLVMCTPEYQLT